MVSICAIGDLGASAHSGAVMDEKCEGVCEKAGNWSIVTFVRVVSCGRVRSGGDICEATAFDNGAAVE